MRPIIELDRDHFTFRGATKLAKTIEHYWHSRGHRNVTTWLHEFRYADLPSAQFAVRSNLLNGLPPKKYHDAKTEASGGIRIGRPRKPIFAENSEFSA